jgi:hypothetical protein
MTTIERAKEWLNPDGEHVETVYLIRDMLTELIAQEQLNADVKQLAEAVIVADRTDCRGRSLYFHESAIETARRVMA